MVDYYNDNDNDDNDNNDGNDYIERLRLIDFEISTAERSIGSLRKMRNGLNDRLRNVEVLLQEQGIPLSRSRDSSSNNVNNNIDNNFRRSSEELFLRYNKHNNENMGKPPRRSHSASSPIRNNSNNINSNSINDKERLVSKLQWNKSWGNSSDEDISFLKSSRSSHYSSDKENDDGYVDLNNPINDPNQWNPYPVLIDENVISVSTGITSMLNATMKALEARIPFPTEKELKDIEEKQKLEENKKLYMARDGTVRLGLKSIVEKPVIPPTITTVSSDPSKQSKPFLQTVNESLKAIDEVLGPDGGKERLRFAQFSMLPDTNSSKILTLSKAANIDEEINQLDRLGISINKDSKKPMARKKIIVYSKPDNELYEDNQYPPDSSPSAPPPSIMTGNERKISELKYMHNVKAKNRYSDDSIDMEEVANKPLPWEILTPRYDKNPIRNPVEGSALRKQREVYSDTNSKPFNKPSTDIKENRVNTSTIIDDRVYKFKGNDKSCPEPSASFTDREIYLKKMRSLRKKLIEGPK